MKRLLSLLLGALLAGSTAQALAADPPGAKNEQDKRQQTQDKRPKDKPMAKPSSNQRRNNVPET